MSRVCILLYLLLSACSYATGQNATVWPPIPPDELTLKESPAGKNAPAIILDRQVTSDDNTGIETYYQRLKILTKEGANEWYLQSENYAALRHFYREVVANDFEYTVVRFATPAVAAGR